MNWQKSQHHYQNGKRCIRAQLRNKNANADHDFCNTRDVIDG